MHGIRDEDAKAIHGDELGAALLVIKDLRGALQLATHNPGEMTKKQLDKEINAATKILRKYRMQAWG